MSKRCSFLSFVHLTNSRSQGTTCHCRDEREFQLIGGQVCSLQVQRQRDIAGNEGN